MLCPMRIVVYLYTWIERQIMFSKLYHAILAVSLIFLLVGEAFSAAAPHPACPWLNPRNSWVDFIMGQVPLADKKISKYFSVRFEGMKGIADSKHYTGENDPLGKIWKGECYTVYFSKDRWVAVGYNEIKRESEIMKSSSLDAHPEDYLISIGGTVFEYNEAGEIFDADYGHVGNFRCVLDRQLCKNYAD